MRFRNETRALIGVRCVKLDEVSPLFDVTLNLIIERINSFYNCVWINLSI